MRIAFLGDSLDLQYAGIHVYTREIIRAVTALDHSNTYLLVRSKSGGEYRGVKEIVIPIRSYIPMHQRIRQFRNIPKRLIEEEVDLVIEPCHFGPFNLPQEIKRITVIHDLTPILFPAFHSYTSHIFHKRFFPGIINRANHIITNSNHTKSDVLEHYPNAVHKTTAIPLGKDESFKPVIDTRVLDKHKIKGPYFLHVGTLEPRKNLSLLLDAYEKLRHASSKYFQLVLVGKKGWKIDAFMEDIARSPFWEDIKILGYVDHQHLTAIYSGAMLFIYPSIYEGFGLPVLEAMACGTPVLISNTSSLPEVGGNAAHYFNPESVNELYEKMLWLSENEAQRKKSQKASLKQAAKFSWNSAAKQMIEVFENTMQNNKI